MFFSSCFLLLVAVALAYPVPIALSRALWSIKSPMLALFVWQAVALSGGFALIGSFLIYGLAPLANPGYRTVNLLFLIFRAFDAAFKSDAGLNAVLGARHFLSLCVAIVLSCHLLVNLVISYYRLHRGRIKHQNLLTILATRETICGGQTQAFVIADDAPLAYWLPLSAINPASLPVVSRGLLNRLSPSQLQAVIAHAKTHIKQRHDLLQWAFFAWKSALPWLPTAQKAWISVTSLIEIAADNRALKTVRAEDLKAALHYLENMDATNLAFPPGSYSMLYYRRERLSAREQKLGPAEKTFIGALSVSLLLATSLILFFPALI